MSKAFQSPCFTQGTSVAWFVTLPYNRFVDFRLVSNYKPQGDQAKAIEALTRGFLTASNTRFCSG